MPIVYLYIVQIKNGDADQNGEGLDFGVAFIVIEFTILPLKNPRIGPRPTSSIPTRCAALLSSLLSHEILQKISGVLKNSGRWGKGEKEGSRYSGI